MRTSLYSVIGAAGIVAAGLASPAGADNLNSIVRTFNTAISLEDAQRLEEQARRNQRVEDERYWHNYRIGLEEQRHDRGGPTYGGGDRYPNRIGLEDARRLEEQARRDGRREDERYWHSYAMGLPGYREENRSANRVDPEEASRLEEQARRNGRWDEARYWAAYRSGLR